VVSWLWFLIGLLAAELFHTTTKVPRGVSYSAILVLVYVLYITGALPLEAT